MPKSAPKGSQGNPRPLAPGGGKGRPAPPLPPPRNDNVTTDTIGSSSVTRENAYPRANPGPPGRKK